MTRASTNIPLPPGDLARRVGSRSDDELADFLAVGRSGVALLRRWLPADRPLEGARILDFGCGAGRMLRHLVEVPGVSLIGCDIHEESIAWLQANIPDVRAFVNSEWPPLPLADESVDIVNAASVFTHLADSWSAWLVEIHRILDHDGVLVATFLGPGMSEAVAGEPWDEDRIGMNVLLHENPWECGGPMVLHSPWWIHEHWGRAFDVASLDPLGFSPHGVAVLRKREVSVAAAELERLSDDPREITALRHNVAQLHAESRRARAVSTDVGADESVEQLRFRLRTAELQLAEVLESRSWRITRPLRSAMAVFKRRRA